MTLKCLPCRRLLLALLTLLILPTSLSITLTVTTDRQVYEPGDIVELTIKGPPKAVVGVEVRGPRGEIVVLKQLVLDEEGVGTVEFQLGNASAEGSYTVYVATRGALAKASFLVTRRAPVMLLLAPPGLLRVGEENEVLCFVFPGLSVRTTVYWRPRGVEWRELGSFKSNSSGWLKFSIRPESEGVYEVRVVYGGSEAYSPSSVIVSVEAVSGEPSFPSMEVPSEAMLGDIVTLKCPECTGIVVRTCRGEKKYGSEVVVKLDEAGPWAVYPEVNGSLGQPRIMIVKAKLRLRLRAPTEVGVGEPVKLTASLEPPAPALEVAFYEVKDEGRELLGKAITKPGGEASIEVRFSELGDHVIVAECTPTSVYEVKPSEPVKVGVVGERVYVRFIVVDAAGRRLYESKVQVGNSTLEAPMGVAETAVKAGEYDVAVYWHDLKVYSSRLRLEGGNVTLKAELYDLKVRVVDFTGAPVAGESVELLRDSETVARIPTDSSGVAEFLRLVPGSYVVRARGVSVEVEVPAVEAVEIKLPMPLWIPAVIVLVAVAVAVIIAVKKLFKGSF